MALSSQSCLISPSPSFSKKANPSAAMQSAQSSVPLEKRGKTCHFVPACQEEGGEWEGTTTSELMAECARRLQSLSRDRPVFGSLCNTNTVNVGTRRRRENLASFT